MEKLYSLKRYSSSLTWYFSVCLALLFGQFFLNLYGSTSGHIFLTGILIAIAVDQGIELRPQWTQRFKKLRAFNLLKAALLMVLACPAFAMILQGGMLFTALVGALSFAFTEALDYLKPHLGELAEKQFKPAEPVVEETAKPSKTKDPLQKRLLESLKGKTILILGASRQTVASHVAKYKPKHLILVDNHVDSLDALQQQIKQDYPNIKVTAHVKIPEHRVQIQHIFEQVKADLIIYGAFESNGPILDKNPSFASRINVIDTIDWVDASRKNGVPEFAVVLPAASESTMAGRCFAIIHRYCQGLQGDAKDHPTRLLILEEDEGETVLTQYIHALSNQVDVEPPHNFPMFQRALHQLEWAVNDYNNNEVESLLDALTQVQETEAEAA